MQIEILIVFQIHASLTITRSFGLIYSIGRKWAEIFSKFEVETQSRFKPWFVLTVLQTYIPFHNIHQLEEGLCRVEPSLSHCLTRRNSEWELVPYTAGLTRFRAIEWLSAQLRVLKQCCFINITGENGAFDYEKWNCEVISNLWILVSRQIMSCLKRDSRVIVNRKNKFQNEELSKAESDSSVAVFLGK